MTTIYEIAKKADVSVGTVDRVIHHRGRVSKETAEKVNQLIQKLGYKPNVLARNLSLKKIFTIGILIPNRDQDGEYWDLPARGIDKAIQEIQMYNVESLYYFYDKYSEDSFKKACLKVLRHREKLAGLIMAPVLSKAAENFIQTIPDNLPYVFIDSYVPNSKCMFYIGQESFQSGMLAARLMNMLMHGSGTIAVIRILPEEYHIIDRIEGFTTFFKENNGCTLRIYNADRMRDGQILSSIADRILHENKGLKGVFVPHACVFQVAESLREKTDKGHIFVIGYDLVDHNRKCLNEGTIDFIISQRPENQGYQAISILYKHIVLSENVDHKIIIPMDIITKENMNSYQI